MTISTEKTGETYGLYPERSEFEREALEKIRGVVAEALMLPGMGRVYSYDEAATRLVEHLAEKGWMIVKSDSLIF